MSRSIAGFRKRCARIALACTMIAAAPFAVALEDDFRIEAREGQVESLDYATNKAVVAGVSFDVAVDADVQLGGSYGAFTMVTPGMNVKILFKRYLDTGRREIVEIKELPPGVTPRQY